MSAGGVDFYLSEDDLSDPKKTVGLINDWMGRDSQRRQERAMNWSESINFLAGNQWIKYNQRIHRWEGVPFTDANRAIDRPVTNHLLRWLIINAATFTSRPSFIIDPNSDDPRDKTTAVISDCVQKFLWEDMEKDDQYYEAALWGLTCGTVFRKSFKKFTGQYYGGDKKIPIKQLCADIISPFQIVFDDLASRWRDIGCIMQTQLMRVSDAKRIYSVDAEGYFPEEVEDIKEEKYIPHQVSMLEGLKQIVEGGNFYNMGLAGAGEDVKDSCIVKEVYVRPSRKYPRGRMIVVASDKLCYSGESPQYYLNGKVWHPFTCWQYNKLPGSAYGLGLAQPLIKIQRRINAIDALLAYNRKTVAVGVWLIPSGTNVPEGSMVGTPGQNINYDPGAHGHRPDKIPGTPLPAQIIEEREMLLRDGDRISLAGDIRSGQNPSGVNTLGQLQILTEQSEISRSKQIESWEKFIERSEQLDLLNFQDCYRVPDEDVNSSIKKFSKDITNFDWKTFTGETIRSQSTIRIEKGSTISKSKLLRTNMIMRLLPTGLLGDVIGDPYRNKQILEEFGVSKLFPQDDVDVQYAEKSIEMMLQDKYPPFLDGVHNPDVQLVVIVRHMKDAKYLEYDPKIKALFERKRKELVAKLAEASRRMSQPRPFGLVPAPQNNIPAAVGEGIEKGME